MSEDPGQAAEVSLSERTTKLLLCCGPQKTGEALAHHLHSMGWRWQRLLARKSLRNGMITTRQVLKKGKYNYMVLSADDIASDEVWERLWKSVPSRFEILMMWIAESLADQLGPFASQGPSRSELQLHPGSGHISGIITAGTLPQLQAAIDFLTSVGMTPLCDFAPGIAPTSKQQQQQQQRLPALQQSPVHAPSHAFPMHPNSFAANQLAQHQPRPITAHNGLHPPHPVTNQQMPGQHLTHPWGAHPMHGANGHMAMPRHSSGHPEVGSMLLSAPFAWQQQQQQQQQRQFQRDGQSGLWTPVQQDFCQLPPAGMTGWWQQRGYHDDASMHPASADMHDYAAQLTQASGGISKTKKLNKKQRKRVAEAAAEAAAAAAAEEAARSEQQPVFSSGLADENAISLDAPDMHLDVPAQAIAQQRDLVPDPIRDDPARDEDIIHWLQTGELPAWWTDPGTDSLSQQQGDGNQADNGSWPADGSHPAGIDDLDAAEATRGAADEASASNGQHSIPFRDDCPPNEPIDLRPLLLFDLNGTLTAHTSHKRSTGRSTMRPGLQHLRRLQEHFRLGIFTSSSKKTVMSVVPLLEAAAGPGPRLFHRPELILYRENTQPAPASQMEASGRHWDTCKPLHRWIRRLHRTLLFDDDSYKAFTGEESNMVLVPGWAETDMSDSCVAIFVDAVLKVLGPLGGNADVRMYSQQVTRLIQRGIQPIADRSLATV